MVMIGSKAILALALLAFSSVASGQATSRQLKAARVCSDNQQESQTNVCVIMVDEGPDSVQVIVEGPKELRGWLGVGFGRSMSNSDVYIGFRDSNGKHIIVDRKLGPGHGIGTVDNKQSHQILRPFGVVQQTGRFVVTFRRPKNTRDPDDAVINTSAKIPLIWAYNPQPDSVEGSGIHARLKMHLPKTFGTLELDFKDQNQQLWARQILQWDKSSGSANLNNNATTTKPTQNVSNTTPPQTPIGGESPSADKPPPVPVEAQKGAGSTLALSMWSLVFVIPSFFIF